MFKGNKRKKTKIFGKVLIKEQEDKVKTDINVMFLATQTVDEVKSGQDLTVLGKRQYLFCVYHVLDVVLSAKETEVTTILIYVLFVYRW